MKNIIALAVIAVVIGLALLYIVHSKKKGMKCIGCPYSGKCGKKCDGGCDII